MTDSLRDVVLRDLRQGARALARTPGFTALAAATLALGIGANTAIFSVVDAVLLRPLPFRDPARVVTIWEDYSNESRSIISAPEIAAFRERARSLEGVAAIQQVTFGLRGEGADPELVRGALVTPGLFPLLGVSPALGRALRPDEDRPGSGQAVLITHELWQRRFGADPAVVGRPLTMDVGTGFGPRLERGTTWTVAGVLPPRFEVPFLDEGVEVWAPLALGPESLADDNHYLFTVGRLRPDADPAAAQRELREIVARRPGDPSHQGGRGRVDLVPLEEVVTGDVRPALLVLLGAVGFVLLVACANVAHLVLARASGRRRELAVRAALGARPVRIVRYLLAESVLLALVGGAAGLLLAWMGVDLLVAIGPEDLPRLDEVEVDPRAAAFTAGISFLTALLFGLVPALQSARPDLEVVLRSGGRGAALEGAGSRLRAGLVVAEVAVALLLLVGAGLLLESFLRMRAVDPGFRAEGALTMHVSLPRSRYDTPERAGAFTQSLLAELESLPGVVSAGVTSILPLSGWNSAMSVLAVEGRDAFEQGAQPNVSWRSVSPGYHAAMGTRLLRGRSLSAADAAWQGDAPSVVLVNEAAAAAFWPGADPVGKTIDLPIGDGDSDADQSRRLTVAGLVGDMMDNGPREDAPPMVYFPAARGREFDLVVRTAGDPLSLAPAVRGAVQRLDPDQPVSQVEPLGDRLARATADTRFQATLVGVFAALAGVLAAIGVYGVVAWVVSRRTGEIGVRMALGAERRDVVREVLGGALRLVGLGVVIGIVAAALLGRALSSLLYGVEAHDPGVLIPVAILLASVGAAAGSIPALRASRLDPVTALRQD